MTRLHSVRVSRHPPAFTLIELLVVIGIIIILGTLIVQSVGESRKRAEGIRCMSNLKSLHAALSAYVSDKGRWPQVPEEIDDPEELARWWVAELKDYGVSPEVWHCPTFDHELATSGVPKDKAPQIHYIPTRFDDKPFTPFKWSAQPWVMEIPNSHGNGPLIIFPNGSIRSFKEVYEEYKNKGPDPAELIEPQ